MTALRCAHAPSTARSFLHLANRSCSYSTVSAPLSRSTPSAPALDFLVPRSTILIRRSLPAPEAVALRRGYQTRLRNQSGATRSFSTSAVRPATVCVQNPVKDEDGNEMVLEITQRAAKRLSQIAAKDQNPNLALRISVESGGCHGFQYLMKLVTIPARDTPEWSSVVGEDDTIFQFSGDSSEEGARIILDEPSLDLLKGSKVDFTQELIGSQFKIVDNPYATSSCGCGTSFDIKM